MLKILSHIQKRPIIGYTVISAFYFFGVIGILSPAREWFIQKTAFNLLLSFLVLSVYQNKINIKFLYGLLFCYAIGFTAEYLGVNYGLVFGEYNYPDTLGPQLGGVPLIIGINWFILTFCFWCLIRTLKINLLVQILLAAVLTVSLDVLIEPVAIRLNFWKWPMNIVPMQNYIGWFLISLLIYGFYHLVSMPSRNSQSKLLLFWQAVFFIALNIFL